MKVSLDDIKTMPLKRLRLSFNEKLPVEGAVKPVLGELSICASAGGVIITGRVKTLLKLNCHVCLRPYFQSLTVDIDEQLATGPQERDESPRERELLRDDFYELIPDDGILDISDIVYQAVTLAAPVFYRCGDECPGPPKSEKALASADSDSSSPEVASQPKIDPRWQNLKTLFSKEDSSENS